MKYYLLFFLVNLGLCNSAFSQGETANWYFGDRAGLSFNSSPPTPLTNGQLQTLEGSATISDGQGNLLFYTDGSVVYNKQHRIMQNGTGLKGNVSSTQSSIIVPKPGSFNKYYIFTVDKPAYDEDPDDPIEGVNYSEVDMSLNAGLGAVVAGNKNIHLITYNPNDAIESQYQSSEKLSAVLSGNCSSYWVITQFVDKFYAFEVTQAGVNINPVISTTPNSVPPLLTTPDKVNVGALGYMKISPNGEKLAIAFSSTALRADNTNDKSSGKVFLYDFNDRTGKVSNEQLILDNSYPYGLEFSPKTSKLYITANIYDYRPVLIRSDLYQYNLNSANIPASQKTINSSQNVAGALQLALNNKIYRAGYPRSTASDEYHFLSVINDPEALGANCDYQHNSVSVGSGAVKLGLPPFVQSFFLDNFTFENTCLGDTTHFFTSGNETYDRVEWDFGDGTTSSEIEPDHVYTEPGTYTVVLQRYKNGIPQDPVCKQVIINDFPNILHSYDLTQCDIGDSDPTDGIAQFNLQDAKDPITQGDTDTKILFYIDYTSAVEDETNNNSLSNFYTNKTRDQVVYAKVLKLNSDCYDISEVTLKTTDGKNLDASSPAKGCDLGDGTAEFDLATIENQIKTDLNLPSDVQITFYGSQNNLVLGVSPLTSPYISSAKTIYLKATDDNGCYGSGKVNLQLTAFPEVQSLTELQACASTFPITLGADITVPTNGNFSFEWSTGETTREIQVNSGGTYTLKIINDDLGCSKTVDFNVTETTNPVITDLQIDSNNDTSSVTVITDSESPATYSLDAIDGPYQTEAVFTGIAPGKHILYVKNEDACGITQRDFFVFGFPKFLTPNNDGYHDTWLPLVSNDPNIQITGIYIYDRYGKLLKQLDPNGPGWDGTFVGKAMPSDDYWYRVTTSNGKVFKGHFTLKR